MADTTTALTEPVVLEQTAPDLSVVIPTYNRRERLHNVLEHLDAQHTSTPAGHEFSFEVIAVSDGSTDGTAAMLDKYVARFELRVLDQNNGGPAAARNAGIEAARADIVVFLDDDVFPEPKWLAAHMHAHLGQDDLVVVGPMLTPQHVPLKPWIRWEQYQLEKQYDRFREGESLFPRQFYTGNASARRDALNDAGLFDTTLRRSEDVELGNRLSLVGQSFVFLDEAEAYHHADRTMKSWWNIAYDYGRNDVDFAIDRGDDPGMANISSFFNQRNRAQQLLIRSFLPGTVRHSLVCGALTVAAAITPSALFARLARPLLSAVYGLHYYRGVADGLGSTEALRKAISKDATTSSGAAVSPRTEDAIVPWLVLEQTLGHITHSKNLQSLMPTVDDVEPEFIPVHFDVQGRAAGLPIWSNWTVRAGLRARRQLRQRLLKRSTSRPDVLFVHSQVPAVLLGKWLRRQPTIVSLDATPRQYDALGDFYDHSPGLPALERAKDSVNKRCFDRAVHLVAWSSWAKQGLVDDYGIEPDKITVIRPGINLEMWTPPARNATSGPLRVLFVGGDLPRKGGDLLMEAARVLRNDAKVPEFELHLVTTTELESEPGVVVHRALTPNSPELIEQYHQADIFCLPTHGDCLPMVLAEAGAAGLPLISTDVAAISSIVRDGETGLLIAPGDLIGLTNALRSLLTDAELRTRLGSNARAMVVRDHDAAQNVEALVELFRSVRAV